MTITLHNASCIDWLASYDGPLFDSCVTDPPYELSNDGKQSAYRVFLEFMFPQDAKEIGRAHV